MDMTCYADSPTPFFFFPVLFLLAGKECIERRLTALQSGLCVWLTYTASWSVAMMSVICTPHIASEPSLHSHLVVFT